MRTGVRMDVCAEGVLICRFWADLIITWNEIVILEITHRLVELLYPALPPLCMEKRKSPIMRICCKYLQTWFSFYDDCYSYDTCVSNLLGALLMFQGMVLTRTRAI